MSTQTVFRRGALGLIILSTLACGSSVNGGGAGGSTASGPTNGANSAVTTSVTSSSTSSSTGGPSGNHYDGKGFVVHEWGTDTLVVGSDGSQQRGLHHEEEDLPGFVYDRVKSGCLDGSSSVEVKMETPVTYFYSDKPLDAQVTVDFPAGVFTQWYPAVALFSPMISGANSKIGVTACADPVMDVGFPFDSPICRDHYQAIQSGHLDWGTVHVLARGAQTSTPDAPLEKYTWSFARQVDANAVRVLGAPGAGAGQDERFLFYRGLGNFSMPINFTTQQGGAFNVQNGSKTALVGSVFALDVTDKSGAFQEYKQGLPAGASLAGKAPVVDASVPMDKFVDDLAGAVTGALDATGLYHDEAVAMVNTWKRQWFRTPGLRFLYLMPQGWTDGSIPLNVTPKPDSMTRVMMIRVEAITPELEDADVAAAQGLASPATTGEAETYFKALGRFAEPRLRRALAIMGNPPYAATFLTSITSASTTLSTGE